MKKPKYSFNEEFFDVIDTEEKAYFLGLLYADGYNNTDGGYVELQLHGDDLEILNKFIDIIKSNRPLQIIKRSNKLYYRLILKSHSFANKVAEQGCFNKKTFTLKFPLLNSEYIRHFIRGYVDGDGSIWINKKKSAFIEIVGTIDFLNGIHQYLKEVLKINDVKLNERHPDRKTNIRTLRYGGNILALKIMNHLYDDSRIFLLRKYNKYLECQKLPKKENVLYCYSGMTYDHTTKSNLYKILSKATKLSTAKIGLRLRHGWTINQILEYGINHKNNKNIVKLDVEGNVLKTYFSLVEAGIDNNLNPDSISKNAKIGKKYKGYYWKFI